MAKKNSKKMLDELIVEKLAIMAEEDDHDEIASLQNELQALIRAKDIMDRMELEKKNIDNNFEIEMKKIEQCRLESDRHYEIEKSKISAQLKGIDQQKEASYLNLCSSFINAFGQNLSTTIHENAVNRRLNKALDYEQQDTFSLKSTVATVQNSVK